MAAGNAKRRAKVPDTPSTEPSTGKVFILDEAVVRPGMAVAYRDAYMARYAPNAKQRGMTLEQVWLTPPLLLREGSNTVCFLWSVPGAAGWWAMRAGMRNDPSVSDWWTESDTMTVSRRRAFLSSFGEGADV